MTTDTKKLSNMEVMHSNKKLLGPYDQQRQFLLSVALRLAPCPICGHDQTQIDAAGVAFDDFDATGVHKHTFTCPKCDCPLQVIIPLFGASWLWARDFKRPWSRDPVARP